MPGGTERGVQCPSPLAKRRRRAELGSELARRQERLLEAEHRLLERPSGEARILGKLELRLAETESRILSGGAGRRGSGARLQLPGIPENLSNGSCAALVSTETLDRAASQSCSTIGGWDLEAAEMAIDYRAEYGALHEYSRVGSQYGLHPLARAEHHLHPLARPEDTASEGRTPWQGEDHVRVRGESAVSLSNGQCGAGGAHRPPQPCQPHPGPSGSAVTHSEGDERILACPQDPRLAGRPPDTSPGAPGPPSPHPGGSAPLAQFRFWKGVSISPYSPPNAIPVSRLIHLPAAPPRPQTNFLQEQ